MGVDHELWNHRQGRETELSRSVRQVGRGRQHHSADGRSDPLLSRAGLGRVDRGFSMLVHRPAHLDLRGTVRRSVRVLRQIDRSGCGGRRGCRLLRHAAAKQAVECAARGCVHGTAETACAVVQSGLRFTAVWIKEATK